MKIPLKVCKTGCQRKGNGLSIRIQIGDSTDNGLPNSELLEYHQKASEILSVKMSKTQTAKSLSRPGSRPSLVHRPTSSSSLSGNTDVHAPVRPGSSSTKREETKKNENKDEEESLAQVIRKAKREAQEAIQSLALVSLFLTSKYMLVQAHSL